MRAKQTGKEAGRVAFGVTPDKPFARAQGKPALQEKNPKHGSEDPPLRHTHARAMLYFEF